MIKLYTPENWRSAFNGYADLIVEDSGYIYSGEDYYKLIKYPIGKIDFNNNKIYGGDYLSMFPCPIGYIKNDDGVIKIYDKNPYDSFGIGVYPILCIQNGNVYTYDEYTRPFSTPSAYMETNNTDDTFNFETTARTSNDAVQTRATSSANSEDSYGCLFSGIVVLGIIIWGGILLHPLQFLDSIFILIPSLLIGGILAYKKASCKEDIFMLVMEPCIVVGILCSIIFEFRNLAEVLTYPFESALFLLVAKGFRLICTFVIVMIPLFLPPALLVSKFIASKKFPTK